MHGLLLLFRKRAAGHVKLPKKVGSGKYLGGPPLFSYQQPPVAAKAIAIAESFQKQSVTTLHVQQVATASCDSFQIQATTARAEQVASGESILWQANPQSFDPIGEVRTVQAQQFVEARFAIASVSRVESRQLPKISASSELAVEAMIHSGQKQFSSAQTHFIGLKKATARAVTAQDSQACFAILEAKAVASCSTSQRAQGSFAAADTFDTDLMKFLEMVLEAA